MKNASALISAWFLALLGVMAWLALASGCGNAPSSHKEPVLGPSRPLAMVGYGVPNACHLISPAELGDALVEAGLGLTVCELVPWFTETGPGCKHNGGLSDQTFPAETREFVEHMRARGITTVIMGVNANNCTIRREWGRAQFETLSSDVMAIGPAGVWYLPVNEPWAGGPVGDWNSIARSSWTGPFLVADKARNHFSGSPYFPVPHDRVSVNACSDSAAISAMRAAKGRALVTTDCTGTLNPGPARAAELARVAKETGTPFLVYDFRGTQPDLAVIQAMGEAIR